MFRGSKQTISKMQIRLLVTLICLTSGFQLLVSAKSVAREVIKVLETFAEDQSYDVTGLNYEAYERTFKELKDQATREQIEKEIGGVKFQFLQDFILTPMERWRPTGDDDDRTKNAYVDRMEQVYKRFWPAFMDKEPINSKLMYNGKFMYEFMRSMQNISLEKPSLAMWRKAANEYNMVADKVEEVLRSEDIYEHLDDLEYDMNYLLEEEYKYFIENYSQLMDECKSDADLQPVIVKYRRDYYELDQVRYE